jgi:hypothetical protein
MAKKSKHVNKEKLNIELDKYLYKGFDLYFVLGWIAAYISMPIEEDNDTFLPEGLIFDENKLTDEKSFEKLIDNLLAVYEEMAINVYEENKLIKPTLDFTSTQFNLEILIKDLPPEIKRNFLLWLMGYFIGFFVLSEDVFEENICEVELYEEKFTPSLFILSSCFLILVQYVDISFMGEEAQACFSELTDDISSMWETDEPDTEEIRTIENIHVKSEQEINLAYVVHSLNNIFYYTRANEEKRLNNSQAKNLLDNLMTRH